MNAEAHHEAIPACMTTWKRTRYLMEGAQLIGRRGAALSRELSSGLDATSRLEALDGTIEGNEVESCVIANVCVGDEETGWTGTAKK